MAASSRGGTTRDLLVVLLAGTSGACDATAFLRVGEVFASVITGNLVLLGVSAVRADGHLAAFAGCALGGYALGALAGARRGEPPGEAEPWPASATIVLRADLTLLALFAIGWELAAAAPDVTLKLCLLATMSAAMGLQSAAVRRLGQVSTTYLTSTLTGLMEALATRGLSRPATHAASPSSPERSRARRARRRCSCTRPAGCHRRSSCR